MDNVKFIGCAPRNFRAGRPSSVEIDGIVIHLIDGSLAGCDATFLDNTLDVPRSAHYGIGKRGELHQYVQEKDTAFHSGVVRNPVWTGLKEISPGKFVNPNFHTIGIEHEGRPDDEWTDEMYNASAALVRDISARYPKLTALSPANIGLHRQIRSDKSCPGNKFDLTRLLSLVSGVAPPPVLTPSVVTTTAAVNLRRGQPSRSAPIVRLIPADTLMHVVGSVEGDEVSENNKWYRTLEGEFFWAGATDQP